MTLPLPSGLIATWSMLWARPFDNAIKTTGNLSSGSPASYAAVCHALRLWEQTRTDGGQTGIARCRRLRSFKNAGLGTVDMLNDTMLSEELFHTPSGGFASSTPTEMKCSFRLPVR